MEQRRLTISSLALGISVEYRPRFGWFFQIGAPGPIISWAGPYDEQEGAHAAAVRTLLYFAQLGHQALANTVDDDQEPDVELPHVWYRPFEAY